MSEASEAEERLKTQTAAKDCLRLLEKHGHKMIAGQHLSVDIRQIGPDEFVAEVITCLCVSSTPRLAIETLLRALQAREKQIDGS